MLVWRNRWLYTHCWIVASSLLGLSSCTETEWLGTHESSIIGGENTDILTHPWQVSLRSNGVHECGGSIVAPSWVVTAASCVLGFSPEQLQITAGGTGRHEQVHLRSIVEIHVHTGFVHPFLGNDIAMLHLSSPLKLSLTELEAIRIADSSTESLIRPGVIAQLTGWGDTTEGGLPADTLKVIQIPIVANEIARNIYQNLTPPITITDEMLAAGMIVGKNACRGDGGGPLTVPGPTDKRVLVGVLSFGNCSASGMVPDIFTRVSVFASWIKAFTDRPNPLYKILPSPRQQNAEFGSSVAISGDLALVGVPDYAPMLSRTGAMFVFDISNPNDIIQIAKLLPEDPQPGELFGTSVAIDGNIAVVGAPGGLNFDELPPIEVPSTVYVFDISNPNDIIQIAKLPQPKGFREDFGASVAISGNAVLVGASREDNENGFLAGAAYLFDIRHPNQINPPTRLLAEDGEEEDHFGTSVALHGNIALIGTPRDNNQNGLGAGSVYRFDVSNSNAITQTKLLAQGGQSNEEFGSSIALNGKIALVGAPASPSEELTTGTAYVFDIRSPNNITQIAKLLPDSDTVGSHFGFSVALSDTFALVGAPKDNAGSAYVFDVRFENAIKRIDKLFATDDDDPLPLFGFSVALSGNQVLVGAPHEGDRGDQFRAGAAYVTNIDIPMIAIAQPKQLATIQGDLTIEVNVQNEDSLVTLLLPDGESVELTPPFRHVWDSTKGENGGATITATLHDAQGQTLATSEVDVIILNDAAVCASGLATELPRRITGGPGISSSLEIDESAIIGKIAISMDITIQDADGLHAVLIAPSGDAIVVFQGLHAEENISIRNLSVGEFVGQNAQGTWRLSIVDDPFGPRTGSLVAWSLAISCAELCEQTITATDTPISIPVPVFNSPDFQPGEMAASLDVPDLGPVNIMTLSLDIDHPTQHALRVKLISPSGSERWVHNWSPVRDSGSYGVSGSYNVNSLADDEGSNVASLAGEDSQGPWRLQIADFGQERIEEGSLLSWSLSFVSECPTTSSLTPPVLVPLSLSTTAAPGVEVSFAGSDRIVDSNPPTSERIRYRIYRLAGGTDEQTVNLADLAQWKILDPSLYGLTILRDEDQNRWGWRYRDRSSEIVNQLSAGEPVRYSYVVTAYFGEPEAPKEESSPSNVVSIDIGMQPTVSSWAVNEGGDIINDCSAVPIEIDTLWADEYCLQVQEARIRCKHCPPPLGQAHYSWCGENSWKTITDAPFTLDLSRLDCRRPLKLSIWVRNDQGQVSHQTTSGVIRKGGRKKGK